MRQHQVNSDAIQHERARTLVDESIEIQYPKADGGPNRCYRSLVRWNAVPPLAHGGWRIDMEVLRQKIKADKKLVVAGAGDR